MPSADVRGVSRIPTGRLGATTLSAVLVASMLGAGCGSSSSTGGGSAFVGRWEIDSPASSFTLACPNALDLTNLPNAALWTELLFNPGVLSDVTEVSDICKPGLPFKASPRALDVVAPDPYTGMAPICALSIPDLYGLPRTLVLSFVDLNFTLLSTSKGEAPKGVLKAHAVGQLIGVDANDNPVTVDDACSYGSESGDIFHRMTKG